MINTTNHENYWRMLKIPLVTQRTRWEQERLHQGNFWEQRRRHQLQLFLWELMAMKSLQSLSIYWYESVERVGVLAIWIAYIRSVICIIISAISPILLLFLCIPMLNLNSGWSTMCLTVNFNNPKIGFKIQGGLLYIEKKSFCIRLWRQISFCLDQLEDFIV